MAKEWGSRQMAENAAAVRTDWDGGNPEGMKGGNSEGMMTIMGKDGQPSGKRETFTRVKARLKAAVGEDVFNSWFARLEVEEYVDDLVHLSVPTRFLCSWVQSNYADKILAAFQAEAGEISRLHFTVRVNGQARPRLTPQQEPASEPASEIAPVVTRLSRQPALPPRGDALSGSALDPKMTFDSFVSGAPNEIALGVARQVAHAAANNAVTFNPVYIHSTVGLGKSHLLNAIAWAAGAADQQRNIVYLTADHFMYHFITAVQRQSALAFKEWLRRVDLLLIDDMQFLQGKSIQHEFCHLINMLLDSARQVVVAADRPPSELESLEPRVRSRLNGGVALEMASPDFSMRLSMLQQRLAAATAEDPSITIGDNILEHVAQTLTGSGRELEGAFNQLLFRQSFEPQLSVDRIDELLGHMYRSGEPKRVRIEDIQRIVARHYNVSKTELLSNRRTRTIVKPRQIAMYLAKIMTPRSLPEIGRRFGGRDHTTVLHAVRKIEGLGQGDKVLADEIDSLKRLLQE